MRPHRSSFLGLVVLAWCWKLDQVQARQNNHTSALKMTRDTGQIDTRQINVTVDDTDPSIMYIPSASWRANTAACTGSCLSVDASGAFDKTFHDGTHVEIDEDDVTTASAAKSTASATKVTAAPKSTANPTGAANPTGVAEASGDDDDHNVDDKKKGGNSGEKHRRMAKDLQSSRMEGHIQSSQRVKDLRSLNFRLDADDPGFVDTPVTAQFKFNGTAIYLFAIQPMAPSTNPMAPTNMNLSFTVDNQVYESFLHDTSTNTSNTATGMVDGVNVFALEGLSQAPHVLLVNVGMNSVFLFDYMIYTQTVARNSTMAEDPGTSTNSAVENKKHNVATFAGAVAGSVGVLGFLALSIFLSIWWRRIRAARREREAENSSRNESLLQNAENGPENGNRPQMSGPRPFIPRYFPGTIPPPYSPSTGSSSHSSTLNLDVASTTPADLPIYSGQGPPSMRPLTYADVPPQSPPPAADDNVSLSGFIPPPPFGVAIASPVLTLPDASPALAMPDEPSPASRPLDYTASLTDSRLSGLSLTDSLALSLSSLTNTGTALRTETESGERDSSRLSQGEGASLLEMPQRIQRVDPSRSIIHSPQRIDGRASPPESAR
ncbi:hypothetical protein C8J56DRAFT_265751 [Mycena floridula]|nr:hypothetical protein C8J56DRAFT_265751 [Mycena floridula]